MRHRSFAHLIGKKSVPLSETFRLEEIKGNVICNLPFAEQVAGEHVALDVLAEQVFVAKNSRVNHPHPHLKTPKQIRHQ